MSHRGAGSAVGGRRPDSPRDQQPSSPSPSPLHGGECAGGPVSGNAPGGGGFPPASAFPLVSSTSAEFDFYLNSHVGIQSSEEEKKKFQQEAEHRIAGYEQEVQRLTQKADSIVLQIVDVQDEARESVIKQIEEKFPSLDLSFVKDSDDGEDKTAGGDAEIPKTPGSANMKMVNGGRVDYWTCVNFSMRVNRNLPSEFCKQLIQMCVSKGMEFNPNPLIPLQTANPSQIERVLLDVHKQCSNKFPNNEARLQLLIIILPDATGSYGQIKRICETELGIVSQCCKPNQAAKLSKQYFENVAFKINVKVGGRNTVQKKFPSLDLSFVKDSDDEEDEAAGEDAELPKTPGYIEGEVSDGASTGGQSASGRSREVQPLPVIKDNVKDVMFYC